MKLLKIRLQNFKAHKALELIIRPGIVGVMGKNGAGKSSFLEGIYFGLTGKTLNGESRSDLRTWGTKDDSLVELCFTHNGKTYTLTRYVNKNNAVIAFDDTKVIGITEVATFLNTHIGLDYDIIKQVLFVAQEQLDTPLKGTESSRKDAFGKLFGCDALEKMRDVIQGFCSEIPVNRLLTEESLSLVKGEIEAQAKQLADAQKDLEDIENKLQGMPSVMELAAIVNKKPKELIQDTLDQTERMFNEYHNKAFKALEDFGDKNIEDVYKLKAEAQSKLDLTRKGVCPTCHTVLHKTEYKEEDLLLEINEYNESIKKYNESSLYAEKAEAAYTTITKLTEDLNNAPSKADINAAQATYNEITSLAHTRTNLLSIITGYQFVLQEKQKNLNSLQQQLADNNKKLAFIEIAAKIRAAFHRDAIQKDLRTFGADSINASLTECLSMFNVPYSVYFTTDGLAKFTDDKKQEHDFMSLSGGQKKIVSLAYRLALMRMFTNNISICVLDEPTSFIDTSNIEAMKNAFVSLSEFAQQNNMTIFIATHEYSLVPIFDALVEL